MLTMKARRSGIIIRMPSRPPRIETTMMRPMVISKPTSSMAGMVTPTPKAIDSPAEPAVCVMLFSRMVAGRKPKMRAEAAEEGDGQDGDGDGGGDGHADAQDEVERTGAEDDTEDGADEDGLQGELGQTQSVGDVRGEAVRGRVGGHADTPRSLRGHRSLESGPGALISRGDAPPAISTHSDESSRKPRCRRPFDVRGSRFVVNRGVELPTGYVTERPQEIATCMSARSRSAPRLGAERLETRIVPSWAGVPPAALTSTVAPAVAVNASGSASGNAAITANEADFYSFVAPRAGTYRLSAATPSSYLDTVLGVFDTQGKRLAYNDDIGPNNTDSQLALNLVAGQRYLIGVSNYAGTPGGSYTWAIAGPGTAPIDDAYEDNDSLTQAANLGTLTSRRQVANLALLDGNDWFRFTMNGPGRSADYVSMAFRQALGDLDLAVHDSNGRVVRYSNGTGDGERVSLLGLGAGTYYVRIYGYAGASNASYSLDISPGIGAAVNNRVLYLNFDGAAITRDALTRWAGTDWAGRLSEWDSDGNGVTVQPLLAQRSDREAIVGRILALVQDDVRPFGIEVRRTSGGAVEGQGVTTVFVGANTLGNGNTNVASQIDVGNDDRTDVAFVGEEWWGTTERTALAMADVILHEAGHTWGLWHVASGNANETMGLRYSVGDQSLWPLNTTFTDTTYPPASDSVGFGPQNSYQAMRATFGIGPAVGPTPSYVALAPPPLVVPPPEPGAVPGRLVSANRAPSPSTLLAAADGVVADWLRRQNA